MGRILQAKGTKDSLKWIQEVVNNILPVLDKPVNNFIAAALSEKL